MHEERKKVSLVLALCLPALTLACSLGGSGDDDDEAPPKAIVEASGSATGSAASGGTTSDVPAEALGSLQKVFVPLAGGSLGSLDDALAAKGIGNVTSSDFEPRFLHVDAPFGPAVVAYSSGDWVEGGSLFQPMSTTQWLEAALADPEASGVIVNPGHPGQILALSRAEVEAALGWLPRRDPLPMEIYVAR